jgi:hypothetical protein
MSALSILLPLAQIPVRALSPDEPRFTESSSIPTLLLGTLLVVFAILVAFKVARRNQVKE